MNEIFQTLLLHKNCKNANCEFAVLPFIRLLEDILSQNPPIVNCYLLFLYWLSLSCLYNSSGCSCFFPYNSIVQQLFSLICYFNIYQPTNMWANFTIIFAIRAISLQLSIVNTRCFMHYYKFRVKSCFFLVLIYCTGYTL